MKVLQRLSNIQAADLPITFRRKPVLLAFSMHNGTVMIVQARVKGILCEQHKQVLTAGHFRSRWAMINLLPTCLVAGLEISQLLCYTDPIVFRDRALAGSESTSATTASVGTALEHGSMLSNRTTKPLSCQTFPMGCRNISPGNNAVLRRPWVCPISWFRSRPKSIN